MLKMAYFKLNLITIAGDIGEANVISGYTMDIWGITPADQYTDLGFLRTSGAGGNILRLK